MISFPYLGAMGRLGNQLFQMAATIAVAADNGDSWAFPSNWGYQADFPVSGCFRDDFGNGRLYDWPAWQPYKAIPYEPGLRIMGFFQSERYFAGQAGLVRSLLTPKAFRRAVYRRVASVHVRRTDYLPASTCWPTLTVEYYMEAARMLAGKVDRFFVYSDDPQWCRDAFRDPRFVIRSSESSRDVQDLAAMASCEHHIIANSTFSWWGAWLDPSPEKTVIAPKRWFGPDMAAFRTDDLFPDAWTLL